MYERFYDLKKNPFSLTPDPSLFFFSEQHEEALSRMVYGVQQNRGLVVITGEVGTGKTTVVRKFLDTIGQGFEVILIFNTFLSPKQLLEAMLMDLGIAYHPRDSKVRLIKLLYDYLLEIREEGRRVVLVIDEAQNLSPSTLEEVRMLTNLETTTEKLLQIVLVGQPELQRVLEQNRMRQLKQRVFLHYHLTGLSFSDAVGYLRHRLVRSGGDPDTIFTPEAMALVVRAGRGIPRELNILADNCLITGFAKEERPITVLTVEEVIRELGIKVRIGDALWEG